MNSPKVSIIIPTYNRANLLEETLETILSQSFKDWECIVVDDGSDDTTKELLHDLIKKDKRFIFRERPMKCPKGANSCRNFGLELARGEYVKWFDSDDLMEPDHLKVQVEILKNKRLDFVVGLSINFEDETGNFEEKPYHFDRSSYELNLENFAQQRIGWITDDFLGTKVSVGDLRFNTRITTDGDEYNFFVQYLAQGAEGAFIDEVLTKRRVHSGALTNKSREGSEEYYYKICKIQFLTFLDIENSSQVEIKRWFLRSFMLYAYYLSRTSRRLPFNFLKSLPYISAYFSPVKAFSFLIAIFSAAIFKKGYFLLKYARS